MLLVYIIKHSTLILIHLFIFYLKYPIQNEYLLTYVELPLLFMIVIDQM